MWLCSRTTSSHSRSRLTGGPEPDGAARPGNQVHLSVGTRFVAELLLVVIGNIISRRRNINALTDFFVLASHFLEFFVLALRKANNKACCWVYRSLQPISQSTRIVVSSSLLIYGSFVTLTKFIFPCVEAGWKLIVCFCSLLLLLSIQPTYSPLLCLLLGSFDPLANY